MAAAPTFELASLLPAAGGNGSTGFTLFGVETGDRNGWSVAGAGDVNNDGFDDVIVGSLQADGPGNTRSAAGEVHVIFGRESFTGAPTLDLGSLNGTNGFTIFGVDIGDNAGGSVAAAGDVNNDGFDDLIIGANVADGPGNTKNFAGEAYVVFGKASFAATPTIDLAALNGVNGFTLTSIDEGDQAGISVAGAGDVNNDGFDDVIIGAPFGDGAANTQTSAGESYVVFGKASFAATPTINLASLNGTTGFIVYGADGVDALGRAVAGGDINGDGFSDLIIGAYLAEDVGKTYVVFGKASFTATPAINVASLDGVTGVAFRGTGLNDHSGTSVAFAGDVNGDGKGDLLIGVPDTSSSDEGRTYVLFGRVSFAGTPTVNLGTVNGVNGFILQGIDSSDFSGRSVAAAGDVNGDGFDDLIIGASHADGANNGVERVGESYVVYGRASFAADPLIVLSTLNGPNGFRVYGVDILDYSGASVSGAGDVNGDGFADFIIGAPDADGSANAKAHAGESYIVFGKTTNVPHVVVLGNNVAIADGDTTPSTGDFTDFGFGALLAPPVTRTFTVRNDGPAALHPTALTAPAGFSIVEGLSATIAPGASDTFTVGLDSGTTGIKTGQVTFNTDDPTRPVFNFTVTGNVTSQPEATVLGNGVVIADGDTTPTTADHTDFGRAGLGEAPATRTFTVRNDGTAVMTMSNLSVPSSYTIIEGLAASLAPGASDTFTVRLNTVGVSVGVKSGQISFNVNDFDEAPYNFTITGEVTLSKALVTSNSSTIADGDLIPSLGDSTNFGIIARNAPASRTFAVRNNGAATINLSGFSVPAGFTVAEALAATLAPGASDTFTLALDTSALGFFGGEVRFTADDAPENPYNFNIMGSVAELPEITVVGNGVVILDEDTSPSLADHTDFGGVELGGQPIDRTFTIRNDGTVTLSLGWQSWPGGFQIVEDFSPHILPGESDTFTVRLLTNNPGVISGFLRIATNDADEPVFNFTIRGAVGPEVTVLSGATNIDNGDTSPSTADLTVFPTIVQGAAPSTRTFTVRNDGGTPLNLSGLTVSDGFTITEGLAASIAPGATDTFTVQLDSGAAGTKTGTISFINDDANENPFTFNISGVVAAATNTLDLTSLQPFHGGTGAVGITLYGVDQSDGLNLQVASAGDVNGDGFDDLLIGARDADGVGNAKYAAGETYVVFGRTSFAGAPTIELSTLDGTNGFTMFGVDAGDFSGRLAASAGDVNGDGFDDIIIGASGGDAAGNAKSSAGETYVVFGKSSFAATPAINLGALDGLSGFTMFGLDGNDNSGASVAGAGDLNDDGFDDIVIGAPQADGANNALSNSGEVYVVFGKASFASTPVFDLGSLDGVSGFILRGTDESDRAGGTVAAAGDVNNDGIADLLIAAHEADGAGNAKSNSGEAYVLFGRTSFAATPIIPLASLNGVNGFAMLGVDPDDRAGHALSAAGDVNGDGFGDFLVSPSSARGQGNLIDRAGETYVVYGKADFSATATIDLATLNGANGFTLFGSQEVGYAGQSVGGVGDVNGDGLDDLLIGAHGGTPAAGRTAAGLTFLIYGRAAFPAATVVDLATLGRADGITFLGVDASDRSGRTVAGGDVNGDGLADLIIGASGGDGPANNRDGAGEIYVIFGKPNAPEVTVLGGSASIGDGDLAPSLADLTDFGAVQQGSVFSRTFTVRNDGNASLTLSGLAVSAGFTITEGLSASLAPGASDTFTVEVNTGALGTRSGQVTLTTGDADESSFNFAVTALVGLFPEITVLGNGTVIADGDLTPATADATDFGLASLNGPAVVRVFTLRNDGLAALNLSLLTAPAGYLVIEPLAASIAPGSSDTFSVQLDLASIGTKAGQITFTNNDSDEGAFNFAITGVVAAPEITVLGSGQNILDGDSTPRAEDLTVFGTTAEGTASISRTFTVRNDGAVPLNFAQITVPAGFTLTDAPAASLAPGATDTFTIRLDSSGVGVKSGPVILTNDDPNENPFEFMITGVVAPPGSLVDLATLLPAHGGDGTRGVALLGVDLADLGNLTGRSVASAGDVNNDGFEDVIIGAHRAGSSSSPNDGRGQSYLVFGRPDFTGSPALNLGALDGVNGFMILGAEQSDRSGFSVAGAGDVNGDGFDDLIIGTRYAAGPGNSRPNAGESYVIFGKASFAGTPVVELAGLTGANGFTIYGAVQDDRSGFVVAGAGDVNNDGFDDVIIGAPSGSSGSQFAGTSHVVFGKAAFTASVDLLTLNGTNGFTLQGIDSSDRSGTTVAGAGDVNGDGFDDILVGAYLADGVNTSLDLSGETYLIFGKASFAGSPTLELSSLNGTNGVTLFGAGQGDRSGMSLAGAGDFNGDGFDDLLIGASYGDADEAGLHRNNGESYIVFGKAVFAATLSLAALDGLNGITLWGADIYDSSARAVAGAGDVNGDGFDDVIIGTPGGDGMSLSEPDAGESYVVYGKASFAGTPIINLESITGPNGFIIFGVDDTDRGGAAVAAADVNGDGFSDLIIGAPNVAQDTGEAYIVFGKAQAPEVTVLGGGAFILDEHSTPSAHDLTDFGTVARDSLVSRVLTVRNDGTAPLLLGALNVPAGFVVTEGLPASLAPGASDTFTLRLDTSSFGTRSGQVVISSNDASESTFSFAITGTVAPLPAVVVLGNTVAIADEDATPSTADHTDFGDVATGTVATRTFTVRNDGLATLTLASLAVPAGFTVTEGLPASLAPGASDTFTVQVNTSSIAVRAGQIVIASNDPLVPSFNFSITANVFALNEVTVLGNSANIDDGDVTPSVSDFTDFGTVAQTSPPITRTFTVRNDGAAVLTLSGLSVPAGFTVTEGLSASIASGASDTFTVRLDTTALGVKSGQITFTTNNPAENPFNFSITGAVALIPEVTVLGNGFEIADGEDSPSPADGTDFGPVVRGDVVTRTFTVRNDGAVPLNLSGLTVPGGYTIVDGLAATIAPGGSDTFTLRIEANLLPKAGWVSFDTNDADEGLFDFRITGAIVSPSFDLASLLPANGGDGSTGVTLFGAGAGDFAGTAVASAGDINGDGIDDMIVGAHFADGPADARQNAGETYVVFGRASFTGIPTIDLAALNGTNGFTLLGVDSNDISGGAVASAGDVNGDGFDDLIIGATQADGAGNAKNNAGETYVIFGRASFAATPTIEVSGLDGVIGFTLRGVDIEDFSGGRVAGAGDVNNDGFGDIIIGGGGGDGVGNAQSGAGESYVVFGKASFASTPSFDLSTLDGINGFIIYGADTPTGFTGDGAGNVAGAGDVNGDGFDDLLIGASRASAHLDSRNAAGETYIVFGKASFAATPAIHLAALDGVNGVIIYGVDTSDNSGVAVAGAGDVNGDGFDDIVIGADRADALGNVRSSAGDAYVVFGKASFAATPLIDLATLSGVNGFTISGINDNNRSGWSVAGAGDFNGDGFDDLVVAAPYASTVFNSRPSAGETYIVYGRASFFAMPTINLAALDVATGLVIQGAETNDLSGYCVDAGDFNGDGIPDILVGAREGDGANNAKVNAGEAYIVFGKASAPDVAAPTVQSVRVRGTAWDGDFPFVAGYAIAPGEEQLQTLAWSNINQLSVVFSESVDVAAADLQLHGVSVADYPTGTFTYNAATFTATWTLPAAIAADKLLLMLPATIEDAAGNALDGEWSDGTDAYPSGNGVAGGAFQFRFNVLPGDVNHDRQVLPNDTVLTRNGQFESAGGAGLTDGYDPELDIDGSGAVTTIDVLLVRDRQFTLLPAGEPAAGDGSVAVLVVAPPVAQIPLQSKPPREVDLRHFLSAAHVYASRGRSSGVTAMVRIEAPSDFSPLASLFARESGFEAPRKKHQRPG